MSRLLVVEDHTLVREGMVAALRRLRRGVEVCQARDAESALRSIEEGGPMDLVLLDLLLPGIDGFALLGILRQRFPLLPVVVVSALGDGATVRRVARLGASGFVHKSSSGDDLVDAVRAVLDGKDHFPQSGLPAAEGGHRTGKNDLAQRFGLSAAQTRVLDLLAQGKSNREIGNLLGVSEGTVKIHLHAVYRALSVSSRSQVLAMLRRLP